MNGVKTELRFFTIADHEAEAAYLRQRHNEGWAFVKVSLPGIYRFVRCVPEDVIYQLDYNPASISDRAAYLGLFADCGWEYLQDLAGYSYFRKPAFLMDGDEEIFCDDRSRLDMLRRVFKGRVRILLVMFFCSVLPQFLLQAILHGPFSWIVIFLEVVVVIDAVLLARFGWKYYKLWRKVQNSAGWY